MNTISIDPRVNRMAQVDETVKLSQGDNWITFEVFHQKKKGGQHQHTGIVHAPNAEMALVLAKETFARRGQTSSLWVVKSSEVFSTAPEDDDIFATTPEKLHREVSPYKVREKVEQYNKEKSNGK